MVFDGRPVVLFGENGAGKTNLLEAVSLFAPGRGLRRAKTPELARQGVETVSTGWGIRAHLSDEPTTEIATGQKPEAPNRKLVRINNSTASGTDLAQLMRMNWLTPTQDGLFMGPESERRKFLDRLCLAHVPSHGQDMIAYEKSRSERNRLLSDGLEDETWFATLEADLAERGARIARTRVETVRLLQGEIENQRGSAFPEGLICISGDAEDLINTGADIFEVRDFIQGQLHENRSLDRRAGRTLRGTHKSELAVTHKEKNMPAVACSTGEQKALLTGLVMAHVRTQNAHNRILLLDEIAAHLDEGRRVALIEYVVALDAHVFLTGTDQGLFSAFDGCAQMFRVSQSTLNEL